MTDAAGNLWITNPSVKHQLHVLKPDGSPLKSFSYPGIDNQFEAAGEIVITKTDTKWIIVSNTDSPDYAKIMASLNTLVIAPKASP